MLAGYRSFLLAFNLWLIDSEHGALLGYSVL